MSPASEAGTALAKPRLRGVSHQYAFAVAVGAGIALVFSAPAGRAAVAATIYALSIATMFGVSALYHRGNWSEAVRLHLRRLDHTTIFVAIAGTYTPIALLVLHGWFAALILSVVWGGVALGALLEWSPARLPRALFASLYVAVGWVAVIVLPQLWTKLGIVPFSGIIAGGLLYTVGAVVYARKRPDPFPATFGFHEIFHAFVIAAAATHYTVIAFSVLPRG
ncbi:MAG: channel protein hemolysin family [Actinomycetia bacterium]|nr:channel protein hemolysin family [Actinomycetes bacterium]